MGARGKTTGREDCPHAPSTRNRYGLVVERQLARDEPGVAGISRYGRASSRRPRSQFGPVQCTTSKEPSPYQIDPSVRSKLPDETQVRLGSDVARITLVAAVHVVPEAGLGPRGGRSIRVHRASRPGRGDREVRIQRRRPAIGRAIARLEATILEVADRGTEAVDRA